MSWPSQMREAGFTLIELIVFIIVSSLLFTTILLGANQALKSAPAIHQQWGAIQAAKRCEEWFLEQRRLNGYSSLSCPSTPSASACSTSGYSISTTISCTTWNGDSNYKTITVTVSPTNTSLSVLVGDY